MGITSSLFIGRSALNAYQSALAVVGNNVANVATPGYTRLNPNLSSIPGLPSPSGQVGLGVRLASVRRNANEALEARLRSAISDQSSAGAVRAGFLRIEAILDPLGDQDIGSLMSQFFNSAGALQNNPDNAAARGGLVNTASALAQKIRDQRVALLNQRTDLNREIEVIIGEADRIATNIASLNVQIASAEAGSAGQAGGLRDARNQLLSRLSEFFDVTVREQPGGSFSVYLGNESLVQSGLSRGLQASIETDADGLAIIVPRFKEDNGLVGPFSGEIAGLASARDTQIGGLLKRIDTLAIALIQEVNKIHASGQGLEGFTTLAGLTDVTDPALALSTANNGLSLIPKTGSFFIDVKNDATGAVDRYQINIDLDGIGVDSTLNSVAADITANTPLTATVDANGRLTLTVPAGSSFTFADDTSDFLAGAGLNVFFSGGDSSDIDVNSLVANNLNLVAAAQSGFSGDGSNATALELMENSAVAALNGSSLSEYYTSSIGEVAVNSSAAQSTAVAATIVFESLSAQRESISGVNLDEEAVSLIRYQRAFEGAARFMGVVDSMLQTLLTLIR
ncbi:MAG: flagellar hook-associated protein FlgK [Planctomycetota bacterium]|nr:flagellar hook-associated protein FlgK [Planctomycetota bacterium]